MFAAGWIVPLDAQPDAWGRRDRTQEPDGAGMAAIGYAGTELWHG